jgi:hypothetical protein
VIAVWNFQTGALSRILGEVGEDASISVLAYSPASERLAALPFEAHEARVYDLDSGEVRRFPTNNHSSLALSPDGRRLAVDSLNSILVFDVRSASPLYSLPGHSATINTLAFHPSGKWLVSGSDDRNARWSSDGQPMHLGWALCRRHPSRVFTRRQNASVDEQGVVGWPTRMRQPLTSRRTPSAERADLQRAPALRVRPFAATALIVTCVTTEITLCGD